MLERGIPKGFPFLSFTGVTGRSECLHEDSTSTAIPKFIRMKEQRQDAHNTQICADSINLQVLERAWLLL